MIRYPRTHSTGRAVATFASGRQCAAQGCATVLSIYNPDPRCGLHAGTPLASKAGMKQGERTA
jgi:hypothetical protein